MGERNKQRKRDLEKKILEVSGAWTAPFEYDSEHNAKLKVLSRIGNFSDLVAEPEVSPEERKAPKVIRINSLSWIQMAAAVLALVALPYVAWLVGSERTSNTSATLSEVELPDGSDVQLSSGTSLAYNELTWFLERKVSFQGEAFFDVEPGSNFKVHTSAGDISVLGTKFSVWANGNSLMVHCAEGSVVVAMDGHEVSLRGGEFTRRKSPHSTIEKHPYLATGPVLPKEKGDIAFENEPIGMVLAHLEEASNLTIFSMLDDNLKYTGTLNLNRTKESLELVCKPFGAKFETNAEGYITIIP